MKIYNIIIWQFDKVLYSGEFQFPNKHDMKVFVSGLYKGFELTNMNPTGVSHSVVLGNLKKCSQCNIDKELTAYYKDKKNETGYKPYCKTCHKEKYQDKVVQGEYNLKYKLKHISFGNLK